MPRPKRERSHEKGYGQGAKPLLELRDDLTRLADTYGRWPILERDLLRHAQWLEERYESESPQPA